MWKFQHRVPPLDATYRDACASEDEDAPLGPEQVDDVLRRVVLWQLFAVPQPVRYRLFRRTGRGVAGIRYRVYVSCQLLGREGRRATQVLACADSHARASDLEHPELVHKGRVGSL